MADPMPAMSTGTGFLLFASDATLVALAGGALVALALIALWAERRRVKRKRIDAVGFMPWTAIFLIAGFVGMTLLGLGVTGWLSG